MSAVSEDLWIFFLVTVECDRRTEGANDWADCMNDKGYAFGTRNDASALISNETNDLSEAISSIDQSQPIPPEKC